MKALVTGGAGFIGSHITERLVNEGHQVRVLDNLSSGKEKNLESFIDKISFLKGDIRDNTELEKMSEGCEVIFHQAAVVSVPLSIEHPQETHDVNIQGTLNVLKAARKNGVRRVIFACSAAVYGEEGELPKKETMAPAPISPYGVEKITGEYYLKVFNRLYGVETVSLRYFNVFGPRQDPSSPYSGVISIFIKCFLEGMKPKIFGDGTQNRDFVYISNVVDANMLAAFTEKAKGRCYNVGCGQKTSLNELIKFLAAISKKDLPVVFEDPRPGDIKESFADIVQAKHELGYFPKIGVEEGLNRLWEYEIKNLKKSKCSR